MRIKLRSKNKFIPVNVPKIFKEEKRFVKECLDTGWISSEGNFVNKFEFLECTVAIQAIKENDLEEIIHRKGSIDVLAQHITGVACSTEFCSDSLYSNILKSCLDHSFFSS